MKVIFICTSNKDRSPALEKHFRSKYPNHHFKSAGVNKYFTTQKGTTYLTNEMIDDADLIVFAENIHKKVTVRDFGDWWLEDLTKQFICLNLGDYTQGNINKEYLYLAEKKINSLLE